MSQLYAVVCLISLCICIIITGITGLLDSIFSTPEFQEPDGTFGEGLSAHIDDIWGMRRIIINAEESSYMDDQVKEEEYQDKNRWLIWNWLVFNLFNCCTFYVACFTCLAIMKVNSGGGRRRI